MFVVSVAKRGVYMEIKWIDILELKNEMQEKYKNLIETQIKKKYQSPS